MPAAKTARNDILQFEQIAQIASSHHSWKQCHFAALGVANAVKKVV
jgi:hypothetical protein